MQEESSSGSLVSLVSLVHEVSGWQLSCRVDST